MPLFFTTELRRTVIDFEAGGKRLDRDHQRINAVAPDINPMRGFRG